MPALRRASFRVQACLALFDQAIVSIGRFAVTVLAGRFLQTEQFGLFIVLNAATLICGSVFGCLITGPMAVIGSPLEGTELRCYYRSVVFLGITTASIFSGGLAFATLCCSWVSSDKIMWWSALAAVGSLGPVLLQDLLRRMLISRGQWMVACASDIVNVTSVSVLLVATEVRGILTLNVLFAVTAASAVMATAVAMVSVGRLIRNGVVSILSVARQHWEFGRWTLTAALTQQCKGQGYVVMCGALLGASEIASFGAARNLLGVTHPVLLGIDNVVIPAASREYATGGMRALRRLLAHIRMGLALIVVPASALVAWGGQGLLDAVYQGRFAGSGPLVGVAAAQYALIAISKTPEYGLQALRVTRPMFLCSMAMAIVGCLLAVPIGIIATGMAASLGLLVMQAVYALAIQTSWARASVKI